MLGGIAVAQAAHLRAQQQQANNNSKKQQARHSSPGAPRRLTGPPPRAPVIRVQDCVSCAGLARWNAKSCMPRLEECFSRGHLDLGRVALAIRHHSCSQPMGVPISQSRAKTGMRAGRKRKIFLYKPT